MIYQATSLSYRLKQIDFDGSYDYSNEVLVDIPAPVDYALHQNYPNPFNPVTIINYSLPLKSQVDLVVYNVLGESVTHLVDEEKEVGKYSVEFDATSLPSGIYFYKLQAGDFVETKKMVLIRQSQRRINVDEVRFNLERGESPSLIRWGFPLRLL